ncbi:MAG: sulfotransferase [Candidatus Sulfotelmatobacter sp.]|jgi:hypothetical protein
MADKRAITVKSNSGPVFVVGMWRSGTSLLYTLLNQHPHIALMYEGNLPLLWPLFRKGKARPDWLERWEFWSGALSRHKIDTQALHGELPALPEAMELVYRQYAGLARWGCKSPGYFDCMVRLAKEFPDAHFIVLYRNPFDICRSIVRAAQKSPWFAKPGMPLRALVGYRMMKREADRLQSLGVRVHQIQYEDLAREPEKVLSGICNFLQIPFDPRMTHLEDADRSPIHDAPHHAGVKGKQIFAGGKKDEVLSPSLQRKIQRYVNFWHREYGGTWPLHPGSNGSNTPRLGWMERLLDGVRYHALRIFDEAVIFIYCFAPMRLLRAYRGAYGSRLGA